MAFKGMLNQAYADWLKIANRCLADIAVVKTNGHILLANLS